MARVELILVISVGARTILVGDGMISVSLDSAMDVLPGLQGLIAGNQRLRDPVNRAFDELVVEAVSKLQIEHSKFSHFLQQIFLTIQDDYLRKTFQKT